MPDGPATRRTSRRRKGRESRRRKARWTWSRNRSWRTETSGRRRPGRRTSRCRRRRDRTSKAIRRRSTVRPSEGPPCWRKLRISRVSPTPRIARRPTRPGPIPLSSTSRRSSSPRSAGRAVGVGRSGLRSIDRFPSRRRVPSGRSPRWIGRVSVRKFKIPSRHGSPPRRRRSGLIACRHPPSGSRPIGRPIEDHRSRLDRGASLRRQPDRSTKDRRYRRWFPTIRRTRSRR